MPSRSKSWWLVKSDGRRTPDSSSFSRKHTLSQRLSKWASTSVCNCGRRMQTPRKPMKEVELDVIEIKLPKWILWSDKHRLKIRTNLQINDLLAVSSHKPPYMEWQVFMRNSGWTTLTWSPLAMAMLGPASGWECPRSKDEWKAFCKKLAQSRAWHFKSMDSSLRAPSPEAEDPALWHINHMNHMNNKLT